jgi:5-methylcytosine-specific restriction endonuclease McrA
MSKAEREVPNAAATAQQIAVSSAVSQPRPRRGRISKALRRKVLERDRWKCVKCGKGRPEVQLVLDHIKPVAAWGPTKFWNLRTLCSGCNLKKSDKAPSRSDLFR